MARAPGPVVGGYAEAVVAAGRAVDGSTWVFHPHQGAGLALRWPGGPQLRFGGVVDLFRTRPRDSFVRWESTLGVEGQADWPVAGSRWQLGGHAAVLNGLSRRIQGDTLVSAGFHARHDRWLLRVDVIAPLATPESTRVVIGAGFTGGPAIATMVVTLLGALFVATVEGISS